MNSTLELIIPCDKKNNIRIFLCSPLVAIFSWFLFIYISHNLLITNYWIFLIIKTFLSGAFVLSLLVFISIPFQKINSPTAILNQYGILVKHYGFIPWEEIV